MDFLAYADGKNDLIDIGNMLQVCSYNLIEVADILKEHNLIDIVNSED